MSVDIQQGPSSVSLSAELAAAERRLSDIHTFLRERSDAAIEAEKKLHAALTEVTGHVASVHKAHAAAAAQVSEHMAHVSELKKQAATRTEIHQSELASLSSELATRNSEVSALKVEVESLRMKLLERATQGFISHIAEWWRRPPV